MRPASERPLLGALVDGRLEDTAGALDIDGSRLSREQLLGLAATTAARLPDGGPLAVDATPSLHTVVGVLAGLLAGVPVVPLAADAGAGERDHVLADSAATAILGSAERLADLPGRRASRLAHVPVAIQPGRTAPAPPAGEPQGSSAALILYTSGTTGSPKGVIIGRDAIAANLDALADAWAWTPDDVLVHGLPLYHVHGLVLGVLGPLRVGSRLLHTGRPTPDAYAAAAAQGGSLFFGVPTVWSRLAASEQAGALQSARLLVSGSAGLPPSTHAEMRARCGQAPIERYGMTETLITFAARADGDRRAGTVGPPLPGVVAQVVGESGEPVAADGESVGTLEVRTPSIMQGYLGLPEATSACFTGDGRFVTGDVAVAEPDGCLRIVGRASTDLIKTGGYRVGAGEVEAALLAHPAVAEAAVVGRPDPDLGQVIVAFVVAAGVDPDELSAWVGSDLAAHKRPRRVVLVDSLPRNAMGKVRKDRLAEPR